MTLDCTLRQSWLAGTSSFVQSVGLVERVEQVRGAINVTKEGERGTLKLLSLTPSTRISRDEAKPPLSPNSSQKTDFHFS